LQIAFELEAKGKGIRKRKELLTSRKAHWEAVEKGSKLQRNEPDETLEITGSQKATA